MTSAIEAVRLRSRSVVGVSGDAVALTSLAVFALIVIALTWRTWGDLNGDTGHDFLAGTRFAHGELPYVDYVYYYGPLAPAVLGIAARLGGGVEPFIGLGLVLAGAIVLATYALARMYAGPVGAFLAASITVPVAFAPNQFSFVLPHTSAATLGILSLLCVLLGLGRYAQTGRAGWLAAAGASAGLSALTKPEFALAALAALGGWLGVRRLAGLARGRECTLLLGPAALIPGAVYGAFLTAVSPHRLVYENLDPKAFFQAAGTTMLRARAPLTLASFVHLGAKLLLYAAGVALLLLLARTAARSGPLRLPALTLVAFSTVLAVAISVANPEALRHALQFAYGWIPAGAVVGLVVLARRLRAGGAGERSAKAAEVAALAALAVLAASTYAAFYAYSWRPQMAIYAVPLAAVFLVRLHLVEVAGVRTAYQLGALWLVFLAAAGAGLTLRDARAESATVRGPGGALKTTPAEASVYQAALSWISARTKPGEPILLAPQLTWLYTLSGRENPLPEISLLPGALAETGAESAAIARIERAGVRLAVIDRRTFPGYGHTFFGGSFDRGLAAWLARHFVRVRTIPSRDGPESPTLQIWLREDR